MSNSYKKHPIASYHGYGAGTQKAFRRQEHKRLRSAVKQILDNKDPELVESLIPSDKLYGNEWNSPRDGKSWHDPDDNWWKYRGYTWDKFLKK